MLGHCLQQFTALIDFPFGRHGPAHILQWRHNGRCNLIQAQPNKSAVFHFLHGNILTDGAVKHEGRQLVIARHNHLLRAIKGFAIIRNILDFDDIEVKTLADIFKRFTACQFVFDGFRESQHVFQSAVINHALTQLLFHRLKRLHGTRFNVAHPQHHISQRPFNHVADFVFFHCKSNLGQIG